MELITRASTHAPRYMEFLIEENRKLRHDINYLDDILGYGGGQKRAIRLVCQQTLTLSIRIPTWLDPTHPIVLPSISKGLRRQSTVSTGNKGVLALAESYVDLLMA